MFLIRRVPCATFFLCFILSLLPGILIGKKRGGAVLDEESGSRGEGRTYWAIENQKAEFSESALPAPEPNDRREDGRSAGKAFPGANDTIPDSLEIPTDTYYKAGPFKEFLLGEHYRSSWTTPVKYPVMKLSDYKGGLDVFGMGGGFQTTVLFLEDSTGQRYVMRSIRKNPREVLPEILHHTLADDVVHDQISAANPFGALIVPRLSEAAGIYYTSPELYYMVNSPGLGEYQDDVEPQPMVMEEFASSRLVSEKFGHKANSVIDTDSLMRTLLEDPTRRVDAEWHLRTRLVDMLLNDWDRHEGQFFWAGIEQGDSTLFRSFPLDRDNVLFKMDGVIPKLINRKWMVRKFQHFGHDIRDIGGMNFQSIHMDRRVLAELEYDQWIRVAEKLKKRITDQDIEKAVQALPQKIQGLVGEEVTAKLRSRRDRLVEFARRYYRFIGEKLEVVGTREKDRFIVERDAHGNTMIRVYAGDSETPYFNKRIDQQRVKEIRLYGISADDEFFFKNEEKLDLKVQIATGQGDASIRTAVPRKRSARRFVVHRQGIERKEEAVKKKNMGDFTEEGVERYGYNYQEYGFDVLAPALGFGSNKDDGIYLGSGFAYTHHGFQKYPYASKHRFVASIAPSNGSFNVTYDGTFTGLFGNADMLLRGAVLKPHNGPKFFGMGNETKEEEGRSMSFYDLRKDMIILAPLLRFGWEGDSEFRMGPEYKLVDVRKSSEKFVGTAASGLEDADFDQFSLYKWKTRFGHSTIDNALYPRNGVRFHVNSDYVYNARDQAHLLKLGPRSSFYHTFSSTGLTFGTRIGGVLNVGSQRFFQANSLGGPELFFSEESWLFNEANFRGMPQDRLQGESVFYQNMELRLSLFRSSSYLAPGTFGVMALGDHGRVWSSKEPSDQWHYAVGGGVWYNFFNRAILNVSYARSDIDDSFTVLLGFLF